MKNPPMSEQAKAYLASRTKSDGTRRTRDEQRAHDASIEAEAARLRAHEQAIQRRDEQANPPSQSEKALRLLRSQKVFSTEEQKSLNQKIKAWENRVASENAAIRHAAEIAQHPANAKVADYLNSETNLSDTQRNRLLAIQNYWKNDPDKLLKRFTEQVAEIHAENAQVVAQALTEARTQMTQSQQEAAQKIANMESMQRNSEAVKAALMQEPSEVSASEPQ